MTKTDILEQLATMGSAQIKKILMTHGAKEPLFGVRIEDMKKLLKGNKGDNKLAADLFATGNYDAMYLAGLIADGSKMTPEEIDRWAAAGYGSAISEYTVPWVATENEKGFELATKWIESPTETIAVTGWSTFSSIISFWPDEKLDHDTLRSLVARVEKTIHQGPNRVRYSMNNFLISVGSYVPALQEECLSAASRIGKVNVEMNGTACKVPSVKDYITKVSSMGRTGQKRKKIKC